MHADDRRVDHLHGGAMNADQYAHNPGPYARSTPANEAVVASGVGTEVVCQITPWCTGSQDPENAVENTTIVHPRNATRLVRQHRLDCSPFMVGEFVAHDSKPQFGSLNHKPLANLNARSAYRHLRLRSLFGAKRISTGRQNRLNRSKMTQFGHRPSSPTANRLQNRSAYLRNHTVTWVPTSTTRSVGIWK